MFYKEDLRKDLRKLAEKKSISKTEANRRYIKSVNGTVEHIFRGELPFPEMCRYVLGDVLATNGQVMYLYTQDWERGI